MTNVGGPIGRIEQTTPLLAGYETARDWLAKAIRDLDRHRRGPISLKGSDAMFDVIVTLNHVRDWVFELHVVGNDVRWPNKQDRGKWRSYLFDQCPAIAMLADLANAAKHRALQHGARAVRSLDEGVIVYDLDPTFADRFCHQLATFGKIETRQTHIDNHEVASAFVRHRALLLHTVDGSPDWRYAVDVAGEVIQFWDKLIEEFEPKAAYQEMLGRRKVARTQAVI